MRIAVIGAGAIGAVVSAAGVESGHDVTLCVRPPIDSLEVVRDGRSSALAVAVASSPPPGPVADVVFLTVKANDTASAAPWLGALCGPDTLTVAVQNGLDHAARVSAYLPAGAGPVAAGLAYIAAERLGPGRVRHLNGSLLQVPDRHVAVIESAVSAGLKVRGTDDILTASWRKLLANLVANPITALTLQRIGVMAAPGIEELARAVLVEALAVGRAEGAVLADAEVDRIVAGTAQYGSDTGSSMLYDRLAGRPMEHQYLTGEVVRRAATHGIPVPLNSALLALLDALDRVEKAEPPDSFRGSSFSVDTGAI
ncbi:MAG: 2-dehydropantoate 2-reductase [Acidimicrobiales bacterium]|nr:2-dehydropantoate 2-reductase [Acidimicrobiales bacterium]